MPDPITEQPTANLNPTPAENTGVPYPSGDDLLRGHNQINEQDPAKARLANVLTPEPTVTPTPQHVDTDGHGNKTAEPSSSPFEVLDPDAKLAVLKDEYKRSAGPMPLTPEGAKPDKTAEISSTTRGITLKISIPKDPFWENSVKPGAILIDNREDFPNGNYSVPYVNPPPEAIPPSPVMPATETPVVPPTPEPAPTPLPSQTMEQSPVSTPAPTERPGPLSRFIGMFRQK